MLSVEPRGQIKQSFFTLTNAIGGPAAGTNFYSARDVFSWNKGRHSLKLGGELSLNKDIQQTLLNNHGVFTFNNGATKNALADFLIGIPSAVTQDWPVTGYTNSWYGAVLTTRFRCVLTVVLFFSMIRNLPTPSLAATLAFGATLAFAGFRHRACLLLG